MSAVIISTRVQPEGLADALEVWALRREKVPWLLDIRASRRARRIAGTCRVLAAMRDARLKDAAWYAAWERARIEGAAILAQEEGFAPRVNGSDEDADTPSSERITRPDPLPAYRERPLQGEEHDEGEDVPSSERVTLPDDIASQRAARVA